jgi:hypothetical protein
MSRKQQVYALDGTANFKTAKKHQLRSHYHTLQVIQEGKPTLFKDESQSPATQ